MKDKLLATGLLGSVVAVVCCLTTALVVLFGALGISAWLGWADMVLLPALVVFLGVTLYAFGRGRQP